MSENGSIAEFNRRSFDAAAGTYRELIEESRAHQMVVVPAMLAQTGDVTGTDVLCLGHGTGQELELLAAGGVRSLVGIDISPEMLREARRRYTGATLLCRDLAEISFGEQQYDVVYASMTLQFLGDTPSVFDQVLERVRACLRPGGRLVFSLPHPIYFGAEREDWPDDGGQRRVLGYDVRRPSGPGSDEITLLGDYFTERQITTRLQKELEVRFWLRPFERVEQALWDAGFHILPIREPKPRPVSDDDDAATRRFITGLRAVPLIMSGTAIRPEHD